MSIFIETLFSLVAFLVKWQITVVGSVTDMSQRPRQQSEAPHFIKLMTESTSMATQTAAAPSSQEGWNLTFHLIKSCRNSDHRARLERAVCWVQHRRSGMWRFCRWHCHIEIRELVFAGYGRKRERFAAFFQPNISGFNHLLPSIEPNRPTGIKPGGCLFNRPGVPQTFQLSWKKNKSRYDRTEWIKWVPTKEEVSILSQTQTFWFACVAKRSKFGSTRQSRR